MDSMKGDLAETENSGVGGGAPEAPEAPEEQRRRTQEQIVAEEVTSTVDEEVFVAAQ